MSLLKLWPIKVASMLHIYYALTVIVNKKKKLLCYLNNTFLCYLGNTVRQ